MNEITDLEFDELDRVVQEAAVWCEDKFRAGELGISLRTPEFQPQVVPFPNATGLGTLQAAVSFVTEQRRKMLLNLPNRRPSGHVLVSEFNRSISSGESESATNGFYDIDDLLPWDTWIYSFEVSFYGEPEVILLSWVPESPLRVTCAPISYRKPRLHGSPVDIVLRPLINHVNI